MLGTQELLEGRAEEETLTCLFLDSAVCGCLPVLAVFGGKGKLLEAVCWILPPPPPVDMLTP